MITPYLESLIHSGKATFKTFVCGGSTDKHVLNIEQDKYIVILDMTYFSHFWRRPQFINNLSETIKISGFNTQLSILGERGFNRYVFRNNFTTAQILDDEGNRETVNIPIGHVKMDSYLIHTDKVSFNFSRSIVFNGMGSSICNTDIPAYPPPMDYGKEGQLNPIITIPTSSYSSVPPFLWTNDYQNQNPAPASSQNFIQKEFSYPVLDPDTTLSSTAIMKEQYGAPILHINYVEIKGLPNNINSK